jgi:hypothetical protein
MVVEVCGVMVPVGCPPFGVQLPPVGVDSKLAPCILTGGATQPEGTGVRACVEPPSQPVVCQSSTCAFVLQSTPVGDPHVHAEQPRESSADA